MELERKKWRIFGWVAVGIFMSTLDGSIVNIALPAILKDLEGSFAGTEWVVMIYLLTVTSLLLTFGRLSDIHGRRWIYAGGFFLFALGSLLCGISASLEWLVSSRALQGVGAAMLMACSPAIIVDTFPERERGKTLGLIGTVVALGLTSGPALGGVLISLFSWRAIFYINIPIGIVGGWVVVRMFRATSLDRGHKEPFDWLGAVFIAAGLGAFLMGVTHGREWGVTSVRFLAACFSAIGAVILFTVVETRTRKPVFSFSLFKIRLFVMSVASAVFLFMALFSIVFLMPFFLMDYLGKSESTAGLIMITPFVFLFFVSPMSGALYDRIGSRLLTTAGMGVMTLALFSLMKVPENPSLPAVLWRLALAGLGTSIFIPPNTSAAMSAVPPKHRGVASATNAMARTFGMVLGISIAGAVFNGIFRSTSGGLGVSQYTPSLKEPFMIAFHWAMLSGLLMAAAGAVASFLRGAAPVRNEPPVQ